MKTLGYLEDADVIQLLQILGVGNLGLLARHLQGMHIHSIACSENCIFWLIFLRETRSMEEFLQLLKNPSLLGDTLLYNACGNGQVDVIKTVCEFVGIEKLLNLLQNCNQFFDTPLHCACGNGHVNVIKTVFQLVGRDAFLDLLQKLDLSGNTPLHAAAMHNRKDIFAWLLECCKEDADFK